MENTRTTARRLTENELRKIYGGKRQQHTRLYPAKQKTSKSYCLYNPFSSKCWR